MSIIRTCLAMLLLTLGLACAAPAWAEEAPHAATPAGEVHDEAAAEHHQPPLLSLDPGVAVWNLLIFLIVLGILGKFVWPVILKGLQDRENKIRSDLEQAQHAAAQAQATLEQYKEQLAQARKEAQQIVEQSRADAQKVAADLRDQAQREIAQAHQRAQAQIRNAKEQAIAELYAQAATLATQVAGRILQRELRPQDQQALVEQSISELARSAQAEQN
ncbi:MAG TPA: F0F1 ATP synthase subunit B [Phycisphaeraceae bacterium]